MLTRRLLFYLLLFYGLLTGCTVFEDTPAPTAPATATATPTQTPQPTPTAGALDATPSPPDTLTLWIPDVLMDTSDENLLTQQIAEFDDSTDALNVDVRRRRVGEPGGIMPTLRTARDVAPGTLPDLTLLRRESLVNAVQQDLVQPLEGIVPTSIVGELFSPALMLGQSEGMMYGLPYALDMQHMIYRNDITLSDSSTFGVYLEEEIPYLFPAARTNALNTTFLLQYLAAGGTIGDDNTLQVNENILLSMLTFYESATRQGILTADVLEYNSPTDYENLLAQGEFGAALVTAEMYLTLTQDNASYAFSPIPTENGQPITTLNGWMWVMTTTDANQQDHAAAFLGWMLDPARQGEYVRSLNLLPSRRSALGSGYGDDYAAFSAELLSNAHSPLTEVSNSTAARAMQNALVAVITGESTARQATNDVLEQVGG